MKARVFIYLVVTIGLLITTFDIQNTGEGAVLPPLANRHIYEVTIEGTVGNLPFSRDGSLFLVSTPMKETAVGENRINLWLVSGDPGRRGEQGAIMLATNSRFYVNGLPVDFASTTAKNFDIEAHFSEELTPNANAFSFNGLGFETLSKIVGGDLHVDLLPNGEIAGTIVLTGINPETGEVVIYAAEFHGHYLAAQ